MNTMFYNATALLVAEKLEEHGLTLFEYALKQQQVVITSFTINAVICLTALSVFLIFLKTKGKTIQQEFNDDDIHINSILAIISGVIFLITMITLTITAYDVLNWILNPEFMAIKEILMLVP